MLRNANRQTEFSSQPASQPAKQTNNAADRIRKLAQHYDQSGKPQQRILVRNSRDYLRRLGIRELAKGGPLMVGEHEIQFTKAH